MGDSALSHEASAAATSIVVEFIDPESANAIVYAGMAWEGQESLKHLQNTDSEWCPHNLLFASKSFGPV